MKTAVRNRLLELNRRFYQENAGQFSETRSHMWPGLRRVERILKRGAPLRTVLDAGCGNGRLLTHLGRSGGVKRYVGLDASSALLRQAESRQDAMPVAIPDVRFLRGDLAESDWRERVAEFVPFDACFCLAVLHHVPSRALRARILAALIQTVSPGGRVILSNWQPLRSDRERRKIQPWSVMGLEADDVDPGDLLISWRRGARAVRYVHVLSAGEIDALAIQAGGAVLHHVEADGPHHNLNLYSIIRRN